MIPLSSSDGRSASLLLQDSWALRWFQFSLCNGGLWTFPEMLHASVLLFTHLSSSPIECHKNTWLSDHFCFLLPSLLFSVWELCRSLLLQWVMNFTLKRERKERNLWLSPFLSVWAAAPGDRYLEKTHRSQRTCNSLQVWWSQGTVTVLLNFMVIPFVFTLLF